jgi:hypothetical protein
VGVVTVVGRCIHAVNNNNNHDVVLFTAWGQRHAVTVTAPATWTQNSKDVCVPLALQCMHCAVPEPRVWHTPAQFPPHAVQGQQVTAGHRIAWMMCTAWPQEQPRLVPPSFARAPTHPTGNGGTTFEYTYSSLQGDHPVQPNKPLLAAAASCHSGSTHHTQWGVGYVPPMHITALLTAAPAGTVPHNKTGALYWMAAPAWQHTQTPGAGQTSAGTDSSTVTPGDTLAGDAR